MQMLLVCLVSNLIGWNCLFTILDHDLTVLATFLLSNLNYLTMFFSEWLSIASTPGPVLWVPLINNPATTIHSPNVGAMLAGPTLYRHWVHVSCLLGTRSTISTVYNTSYASWHGSPNGWAAGQCYCAKYVAARAPSNSSRSGFN